MKSIIVAVLGVLVFLSGCSMAQVGVTNNTLSYPVAESMQKLHLQDAVKINRSLGCVRRGYTVQSKDLELEYIKLASRCQYNGLARGLYQSFLAQNFKELEKVSQYIQSPYHIVRYAIADKSFYFIAYHRVDADLFVIDYSGELAVRICSECKKIAKENTTDKRLQKSFIQNDFIGNYFSKDSVDTLMLRQ